jgi:hypothetical protein
MGRRPDKEKNCDESLEQNIGERKGRMDMDCTCGGHFRTRQEVGVGGAESGRNGMEASFVHLAAPPIWTETSSHHAPHENLGLLETVSHASALLRAGKNPKTVLLVCHYFFILTMSCRQAKEELSLRSKGTMGFLYVKTASIG